MEHTMRRMIFDTGLFLCLVTSFLFSQQDTIRVACVGNSITEGNAMSSKLVDAYPPAMGRYLGAGYNVKNFGVSGRTMTKKGDFPIWKEPLFAQALSFNPNIVVILLGTNDSKPQNWIHKDEFMPDYYAMIDTFKQRPGNPEIYVCLPLPSFSDAYDIRDSIIVTDIIPMIHQIVDSVHVKLIDLNTPFLDKSDLMPDGIHPLVEGSDLIARIIYKELTGKAIESRKESNVALAKQAYQANSILPQLTDGDSSTSVGFTSTSEPVIINLINETEVDMVQIDFTNFSLSQLSFAFSTSKDSVTWTTVLDTSVTDTLLITEDRISKFAKTIQPVHAKFIRFQISTGGISVGSTLLVNEIKVFESRVVHAPLWGWKLLSETSSSIRVRAVAQKTSNIGEYIKIFRQLKDATPFALFSNYGSGQPLNFSPTIQNGALIGYYGAVYYGGVEITSDTLTIIGKKTTDVNSELEEFYPAGYSVSQNYPNPFNPTTTISFYLPLKSKVQLKLFDLLGRELRMLIDEERPAGKYEVKLDASQLSSGVYFYRIRAESFVVTKKLVVMK
jgi:lysophospholipase L1-like esterase